MESIFTYTDYRKFLKDYFEYHKQNKGYFSLQVFANRAGFKARDYILRVMNGSRNLSKSGIFKLSQAMSLSEKEAVYFEDMVAFDQADNTQEKEHYFKKMCEIRKYGRYQRLREDQYEYFSNWYHAAIRSLLPVINFNNDFEKLARFLDPPITKRQAKQSVALLLRLGLLKETVPGKYEVPSTVLTTGDEVKSLALARFHRTTMDLAKSSIDSHPSSNRDISGVTMSLSREGFEKIKSEIQAFRKKIIGIASSDSDEDGVYQLNTQFFPLSKTGKRT